MGNGSLVGTWKLVWVEVRRSAGDSTHPFGRDATGTIMYDTHGNFAVQIMRPDRLSFASSDMQKSTDDELRSAYMGYLAYYGRYTVDQEENTVTHHVDGSLFPNWVGTSQKRFFSFSGDDQLILTTPPTDFGGEPVSGVVAWERET